MIMPQSGEWAGAGQVDRGQLDDRLIDRIADSLTVISVSAELSLEKKDLLEEEGRHLREILREVRSISDELQDMLRLRRALGVGPARLAATA